jgi:hypothetical protein
MHMRDPANELSALEAHWQIELPETFVRLYRAFEYPFLSPCEFLSIPELASDKERWRGMLPQFLPFGQDTEENFFGFYLPPNSLGGDYPVLFWDHEYDHYYPVASGFEAFLIWCTTYGRYTAQDEFEADDPKYSDEEKQRREFAQLVGLPLHVVTEPIPRNDTELYERLASSDPQGASPLLQLASIFLGRGELERARNCCVRASEAAPWFADPYYLLAETYRLEGNEGRACQLWWQVFMSPIALSTRTNNYDLGAGQAEGEIYEAAAEQCIRCSRELDASLRETPLWRLLLKGDPFSAGPRLALAEELRAVGDKPSVERELLNALTLSTEEDETAAAYARLIAFYEAAGRQRDATLCRRDSRHL